jgi:hypothetical protein
MVADRSGRGVLRRRRASIGSSRNDRLRVRAFGVLGAMIGGAAVVVGLVSCTGEPARVPSAPPPASNGATTVAPTTVAASSASGADLYRTQGRGRCHGDRGQGGRAARLAPVSDDAAGWIGALRAEHARDYPVTKLSDPDALLIYAWLRALD